MKLSRLEQETIISWNQEEAEANVYTASEVVARRLERRLGRAADRRVGPGWEWTVPKGWITIPRLKRARDPRATPVGRPFAAKAAVPAVSAPPS